MTVEVKANSNTKEFKVEVDEMQSFVEKKSNQRWLWREINHYTGEVLAYVLGLRADEMFLQLKKRLEPFGISKFYTDGLKSYERYIAPEKRQVSKYKMQKENTVKTLEIKK
jgi:insertion element IS1 protein InsB